MINELLKVGDWDIAFNGEKLGYHFTVRGVDIPMLPQITLQELGIDGKPGAWFASRQIGTRDITVRLGMLNATRDRVEFLENWINTGFTLSQDKECRLDLGAGYYVNAVMTGDTPLTRNGKWSTTEVTFKCFDPFIYRETHSIELKPGVNEFLIEGTYPVWPVFEIYDPSDTFQLKDVETGYQIKVDNLSPAAKMIIDTYRHRCEVGGAYKPADPTLTDFWSLNPGSNKLSLETASGMLTYTETYL